MRRREPTSAPDRAIYDGRCRDLIGQPKCGLEATTRVHARTNGRSRTFWGCWGMCVIIYDVQSFSRRFRWRGRHSTPPPLEVFTTLDLMLCLARHAGVAEWHAYSAATTRLFGELDWGYWRRRRCLCVQIIYWGSSGGSSENSWDSLRKGCP